MQTVVVDKPKLNREKLADNKGGKSENPGVERCPIDKTLLLCNPLEMQPSNCSG